jgi:hypothetical protein
MSAASSVRHAKTTRGFGKALTIAFYAAIVVGSFMGIPPFVRAAESLLGANIDALLQGWLEYAFAPGMTRWCMIAGLLVGGYGLWTSPLPTFKKCVALFLVGALAVYIYGMDAEQIAIFLMGAITPLLGTAAWLLVNALQIRMLMLYDDDNAMQRLAGKMRGKGERSIGNDELPPLASRLSAQMNRDRVGEALAFFTAAGTLSYLAEISVNVIWGDGYLAIDWMSIFRPGGLAGMAFQLAIALAVLLLTVGSIEYCVRSLQKDADLKEAIEM